VDARRITEQPETNCKPGNNALDTATGELLGETITLYAPLPPAEYSALRQRFLTDKKAAKKLGDSLPANLLEALSVDTSTLRKQGWSQPPAAHKASYLRPVDALKPRRVIQRISAPVATTASFLLIGKPLPRVEDGLRIGELMRMAVMGQSKRLFGEDKIPPLFSGHDLPADNRHRHAFYLPWDSNGDGCIDRLILHVPDGMEAHQQRALENLNRLWSRDGAEWRLALESVGTANVGGELTRTSAAWESVTPYLHPWHVKKRLGIEDQIRRECYERGLSEPTHLERFSELTIGANRHRRPVHFHRLRNRRGLAQPDRLGSFWRLTFDTPVNGPLALGFACHFGLGLFRPIIGRQ
jgi:CRISPR-associated protein Csb2